ncbi:MAG: hypothetical protein GVY12_02735 [Bacteroidetes bacterium]|nr:hypothetical protein [Bacteroidota bacterium]
MPTPERLSTDAWIARLSTPLQTSLRQASDAMTNQPGVQDWLRTASLEAAVEVGQQGGMQTASGAYRYLRDELQAQCAPLLEAVDTLTHGCGFVDINWRPLAPQYSTLVVAFGTEEDVNVWAPLDPPTPAATGAAREALVRTLSKGLPFPKRPHVRYAMFTAPNVCLQVRATDRHAGPNRRTRAFALNVDGSWIDELDQATFEERVLRHVQQHAGA